MTDCFAVFGVPRQPWLDPDVLKEQFLALSRRCHPDKLEPGTESDGQPSGAAGSFSELNAAYQTLRELKARIEHLLELETGGRPGKIEQVSPDSADLFFQVSGLCRQVDAFLAERARALSPLVKAAHFARGLEWATRLQDLQQTVVQAQTAFEAELQSMNPLWAQANSGDATGRARLLPRLEAIYRQLSYLTRWSSQLQERLVQLAV